MVTWKTKKAGRQSRQKWISSYQWPSREGKFTSYRWVREASVQRNDSDASLLPPHFCGSPSRAMQSVCASSFSGRPPRDWSPGSHPCPLHQPKVLEIAWLSWAGWQLSLGLLCFQFSVLGISVHTSLSRIWLFSRQRLEFISLLRSFTAKPTWFLGS